MIQCVFQGVTPHVVSGIDWTWEDSRNLEDQLGGDGSVVQHHLILKSARRDQYYLEKSPTLPIQFSFEGSVHLILCSVRATELE